MILAGIDIGTNTIRLLVTETSDSSHKELYSGRTITRLGQGLDHTGVLAPDAQERTLKALEEFAVIIGRHSVDGTAAAGTSALRNAANAAEFVARAKQRAGIDIQVVSGEEEARLTLAGVHRALPLGGKAGADLFASALVIDIGGGSTELILTRQGAIAFMDSLPLGAVYLTERFVHHDPPSGDELDGLRKAVTRELEALHAGNIRPASLATCAGTAGTITTLAAMDQGLKEYDPDRINGYVLSRASLNSMVAMLSVTTLDARRRIAGLEPGREDIILAGAIIAEEVMDRCNAREMLVSDWGLREGIVFDLYEKMRKTKAS
jgi:exopolyphosphatase / guanosine-5'-triphosphate,3'-diphosphate pyrophosphatase